MFWKKKKAIDYPQQIHNVVRNVFQDVMKVAQNSGSHIEFDNEPAKWLFAYGHVINFVELCMATRVSNDPKMKFLNMCEDAMSLHASYFASLSSHISGELDEHAVYVTLDQLRKPHMALNEPAIKNLVFGDSQQGQHQLAEALLITYLPNKEIDDVIETLQGLLAAYAAGISDSIDVADQFNLS